MLGDDELFFVDSSGGDHLQVVVRTQGDGPVGAFDGHERLRVRTVIGGGFVTRIDDARGAGKAENDGGHVLALDLRVDPDGFGEQAVGLAEEEASEVELMNRDVRDDHALGIHAPWLRGVNVVCGAKTDSAEEWSTDDSAIEHLFDPAHRILESKILMNHER